MEISRQTISDRAPVKSVVPLAISTPIIESIKATFAAEQLESMDIAEETMQDVSVQGKGQVSDPAASSTPIASNNVNTVNTDTYLHNTDANTTTFSQISEVHNLEQPSPVISNSSSSFSGFRPEAVSSSAIRSKQAEVARIAASLSIPPKEKQRSKHRSESSRKGSSSHSDRSDKGGSKPRKPQKPKSPLPQEVPLPDDEEFSAQDSASSRPQESGSMKSQLEGMMERILASITPKLDQLSSVMTNQFEQVRSRQDSFATWQRSFEERLSDLAADQTAPPASETSSSADPMPPSDSLPDYDPGNPWRSARFAPVSKGLLTIEGVGTRPLKDFERYPPEADLPFCYVRLHPDATVREDRVPKETVLVSRERAQAIFVQSSKMADFQNTREVPHKGSFTMFLTSPHASNPFSTKVAEAVLVASREDKVAGPLREEEATSLLFPSDSEVWEGVASTFKEGKLSSDCASVQFKEDLPKLPDAMLEAEFSARCRLERTLSSFTLAESLMLHHEEIEPLKVLVKSMVSSFRQDLMSFALAKRACR